MDAGEVDACFSVKQFLCEGSLPWCDQEQFRSWRVAAAGASAGVASWREVHWQIWSACPTSLSVTRFDEWVAPAYRAGLLLCGDGGSWRRWGYAVSA